MQQSNEIKSANSCPTFKMCQTFKIIKVIDNYFQNM